MNNMIIETIKRLSIDMFIAIMAIEAIVIAAIALSLLIGNRTNYHSKFQAEGCRRIVGVSF